MKRSSSWFVIGFVAFLALISIGLYYAGIGFFNHYQAGQSTQPAIVHCSRTGTTHYVTITGSAMVPQHTTGQLCDKLTITNQDDVLRLIAFGPHEHHIAYDGITEQVLDQNQSLTVMLDQPGNFTFHDHLNDSVQGTFTVSP